MRVSLNGRVLGLIATAFCFLAPLPPAVAAVAAVAEVAEVAEVWSNTEAHFMYGNYDTPTFAGGGSDDTFALQLQHASRWKYGNNFFFVNFANSGNPEFNDGQMYAEWWSFFSWNRIRGKDAWSGPVAETGFIMGLNWSTDLKLRKYLPGVRFALNIPKFRFANLDFTAYIDDSGGIAEGGVPKEGNSFHVDFNWALPLNVGRQKFSIEGHVEYIGGRDNEFGDPVSWHFLAQPEFRYDLGNGLWGEESASRLFVGIELQIWINKLGDKNTDEIAPVALVVWRF